MALEAVVFPQDPFGYGSSSSTKDLYNLMGSSGGSCSFEFPKEDNEDDFYFLSNRTENSPNHHCNGDDDHDHHYYYYSNNNNDNSSCMDPNFKEFQQAAADDQQPPHDPSSGVGGRVGSCRPARRRRRTKSEKNKEEIENQRMTHITVERNRRKQMNEYLSVLRSLMPDSYVQRGDQASIIGGAINFVKELEQQVHFLSAQTHVKPFPNSNGGPNPSIFPPPPSPFSHNFFTFPQFSSASPSPSSSSSTLSLDASSAAAMAANDNNNHINPASTAATPSNKIQSSIADIEVSLADSHANVKIRCKKLPKQLLKIVSALHSLHLTVLHLHVSTLHRVVLYSFSLKVEEDCRLSSVDEIARAVYQLLCRIQEEASSI